MATVEVWTDNFGKRGNQVRGARFQLIRTVDKKEQSIDLDATPDGAPYDNVYHVSLGGPTHGTLRTIANGTHEDNHITSFGHLLVLL